MSEKQWKYERHWIHFRKYSTKLDCYCVSFVFCFIHAISLYSMHDGMAWHGNDVVVDGVDNEVDDDDDDDDDDNDNDDDVLHAFYFEQKQ